MFIHIFSTLIRVYLVPAAAIVMLSQTFVGYQNSFIGVNLILTLLLIPMIMWQVLKIFPNLALIRTKNVMRNAIDIVLELIAIIVFWGAYISIFS